MEKSQLFRGSPGGRASNGQSRLKSTTYVVLAAVGFAALVGMLLLRGSSKVPFRCYYKAAKNDPHCYLPNLVPSNYKEQTYSARPTIDHNKLEYHGCIKLEDVCIDQGRFILFNGIATPGNPKLKEHIWDPGFTWHNVPGYPDNFLGTKKKTPWPQFRPNSTADPADIANPIFTDKVTPLVWWPIWPENYGELLLQSMMPIHAMQMAGMVDGNVTFVPVLNGYELPAFYTWLMQPFTANRMETLEELSSREHMAGATCPLKKLRRGLPCPSGAAGNPARTRCFKTLLMCKTLNMFNYRNEGEGKMFWHQALKPGTAGQQIVEFYRPLMKIPEKDPNAIRVAIVKRTAKRRILNLEEALAACNAFQPADATKHMECLAYDFDDADTFLDHLAHLQTFDVLMGMHGAALANGIFLRPHTSLIEIRPCDFDSDWMDNYFQKVHRIENVNFAYKVLTQSQQLCFPGDLEQTGSKAGLDLSWVDLSFKRDQDINLLPETVNDVLALALNKVAGQKHVYEQMALQDPTFFNIVIQ